jgi:hypothetical protein
MPTNERKTENIVRDIFRENKKVFDTETKQCATVEEQRSDIPRIDKLMQYASKRGGGGLVVQSSSSAFHIKTF